MSFLNEFFAEKDDEMQGKFWKMIIFLHWLNYDWQVLYSLKCFFSLSSLQM